MPADFRRLPRALQGAQGERSPGRACARQRGRRRQRLAHWVLWAFGGAMVDEDDHVIINSPETIEALEYAKELYAPSSRARCPGSIRRTTRPSSRARSGSPSNGISIYYAAKNSDDPAMQGDRRGHLSCTAPVGPSAARPSGALSSTRWSSPIPLSERRQGLPALHVRAGAVWRLAGGLHRLLEPSAAGLRREPVWTETRSTRRSTTDKNCVVGWLQGQLGPAAAAVLADFVVVDMWPRSCSGSRARGGGGRSRAARRALLQSLRLGREAAGRRLGGIAPTSLLGGGHDSDADRWPSEV